MTKEQLEIKDFKFLIKIRDDLQFLASSFENLLDIKVAKLRIQAA